MRRRFAIVGGLALLFAAWWLLSPDPAAPETVSELPKPEKVRKKVTRFRAEPAPAPAEEAAAAEPVEAPATEEPTEMPGYGLLVVDVVDEEGRPASRFRVFVNGCDRKPVGRGEFHVLDQRPCTIFAARRDGALWAHSEWVGRSFAPGDQEYVQLVLPNTRTGGLGVSIDKVPEGIRVVSVMPGTPAEAQGLQPGDLIVEVDGIDTRELDLYEFITTMTGPEGTEVDFSIEYPGDDGPILETLTIERQFIQGQG